MSFFEDASLVLIPSAQKTSKVYSVKPTDGTGDLTFTRSNDTASRIAPNGLIEKVRTNLYPRGSALLATGWTSVGATLTAGQTDPNGGTTALRVQLAAGGSPFSSIYQTFTGSAAIYARSVFIKGATAQTIRIVDPYTGAGSTVNLTTSYQRFTAVGAGIAPNFGIQFDNSNDGAAKDFTIAFVQIEEGDIATDYIPTTSAAVSVGPVANVPRLDYLNSSCPRLLLEPQTTNVLTYSCDITNVVWDVNTGITRTANTTETTAPTGYYEADKFERTTNAVGYNYLRQSVASANNNTFSFFVKKGNWRYIGIRNYGGGAHDVFDLDTQTFTNNSGSVLSYSDYGNGWYRISSYSTASTSTLFGTCLAENTSGGEYWNAYGKYAYFWGFQAEAKTYPTSVLTTLGAAVTRGADACSKTGISSLIGQTEGTIFFECSNKALLVNGRYFCVSDGTGSNRIDIYQASATNLGIFVGAGGAAQVNVTNVALPASGAFKFALAYANNDYVWYVNGTQVATDTSASVPATSAALLGVAADLTASAGNAPFSQALLFKTRLTNAQLAELTA